MALHRLHDFNFFYRNFMIYFLVERKFFNFFKYSFKTPSTSLFTDLSNPRNLPLVIIESATSIPHKTDTVSIPFSFIKTWGVTNILLNIWSPWTLCPWLKKSIVNVLQFTLTSPKVANQAILNITSAPPNSNKKKVFLNSVILQFHLHIFATSTRSFPVPIPKSYVIRRCWLYLQPESLH